MVANSEFREEECLLSSALNLEAKILAISVLPFTPSTRGEGWEGRDISRLT